MNLPFSLLPANTSPKLHIYQLEKSLPLTKSLLHIAFVTSHWDKINKDNCSQWRLLVSKRASIYFREDGSYCCRLIPDVHIPVHLQKQIETRFKEKGLVFPYSYRWCLTAKLMNCFLQALQCFSDLYQLRLYLVFLPRGVLF